MNDTIFRILAAITFIISLGISTYFRGKAERNSTEKISLRDEGLAITIALRICGLALLFGVLAYLINPAWMAWSRIELPEGLRWLGIVMGAVSNVLAYWVFSSLGNNVTRTVVTRKNATLVMHGPYRWVRHPLYAMGMIGFLGFALLAENWFVALAAVLSFVVMNLRLPKEEARLIERFGDDYREYMRKTGKFFPKLSR